MVLGIGMNLFGWKYFFTNNLYWNAVSGSRQHLPINVQPTTLIVQKWL